MHRAEIYKIINNFAPSEFAESWDCCGILTESEDAEIQKVMMCLTVTDDVVKEAFEKNCDMIISHHPLFFIPFEYKKINIFCAHTNLDRACGGTTDTLIKNLNLENPAQIKTGENGNPDFVRYVDCKISVKDLAEKLKPLSTNLRYVNNRRIENLHRIAFCAGSGAEFIEEAFDSGADAFVTGDLKFHTALDSKIVVFDIGHFESEILVLEVLENLLKPYVETVRAAEKSPFIYI